MLAKSAALQRSFAAKGAAQDDKTLEAIKGLGLRSRVPEQFP